VISKNVRARGGQKVEMCGIDFFYFGSVSVQFFEKKLGFSSE